MGFGQDPHKIHIHQETTEMVSMEQVSYEIYKGNKLFAMVVGSRHQCYAWNQGYLVTRHKATCLAISLLGQKCIQEIICSLVPEENPSAF